MSKYRSKKYQHRTAHPKIFVWSHTQKAEIEYFLSFKNSLGTHQLMPMKKVLWTPQELIEFVVDWKNDDDKFSEEDGDQIWCIFDVDDFYKNDKKSFLQAIKYAQDNDIKIAYINECFELWILLHFEQVTAPICRGSEIEKRIQKAFKKENLGQFKKNTEIFDILLPFQENAIKNAMKLLKVDYKSIKWEKVLDERGNPSTTVHLLVKEINDLLQ